MALFAQPPAAVLAPRPLEARLVASRSALGATWYIVLVSDGAADAQRCYAKRYEDFQELHAALRRASRSWRRGNVVNRLPELPERGVFGLRRRLSAWGMSDFGARRAEGLQVFLNRTLAQVHTLSDEPALEEFFGADPLPSMPERQRAELELSFLEWEVELKAEQGGGAEEAGGGSGEGEGLLRAARQKKSVRFCGDVSFGPDPKQEASPEPGQLKGILRERARQTGCAPEENTKRQGLIRRLLVPSRQGQCRSRQVPFSFAQPRRCAN